ncbi:MAG: 7-cyano-7-deazaguanine synthase QueC [Nitrospirae bacterium]|nr:7-cyano-7-deazaguanine synthase QueC [Nitrospirota bacterium]
MKRAVVLLSGGVDSTTTGAMAGADGFELYAMTFDYGQRHKIEIDSARRCAQSLKVRKHLIIKTDLSEIGCSALTADIEVPKTGVRGQGLGISKEKPIPNPQSPIPITYVPARNTIFLSFALAWAETIGAEDIFIGANAVDYSGYPDCRPEFIKSFETMANLATKASVEGNLRFRIHAPLINLTKAEIIKKGVELGIDYALTWSCYDPQKNRKALSVKRNGLKKNSHHASRLPTGQAGITHHGFVPCGRCDSCVLRAKGFFEAGVKDPLSI